MIISDNPHILSWFIENTHTHMYVYIYIYIHLYLYNVIKNNNDNDQKLQIFQVFPLFHSFVTSSAHLWSHRWRRTRCQGRPCRLGTLGTLGMGLGQRRKFSPRIFSCLQAKLEGSWSITPPKCENIHDK